MQWHTGLWILYSVLEVYIQHETVVNRSPVAAIAPMANSLDGDTCNAPTKAFRDPFRHVLMILASVMGG
ncbi:hypothetical protein HKD37_08G022786 [Glycine soja]